MSQDTSSSPAGHAPHYLQPGTLAQQLSAIDVYLDDPTRVTDPDGAWQIARALVIPHVRTWYVEMRASGMEGQG